MVVGDVFETWKTAHGDTVEIYLAADGFRYRIQAANGRVGDIGGEAYTEPRGAVEAAARHHPDFADLDGVIEHLVDDAEPDEIPEVELLTDGAPPQVIETLPDGRLFGYADRRAEPDAVFYARVGRSFGERPPVGW